MNNIFNKKTNAYKITYMGDWEIHVQGIHVKPHKEYYIYSRHIAKFLAQFPQEERDNLIYEKIVLIGGK